MRATAVVLAAGLSTRMGSANKLVSDLDGKPLVCHAIDALLESSIEPIVVVTGHDAAAVRTAIGNRCVDFVQNPEFESGMSSSIACGVKHLQKTSYTGSLGAALICLGDMPAIGARVIDMLIESCAGPESIVVPVSEGRRGHPVLFGSAHFDALCALHGSRGARAILDAETDRIIEVECNDPGIHQDVDTPSALEASRANR